MTPSNQIEQLANLLKIQSEYATYTVTVLFILTSFSPT
jgi:hypothetical protein